MATENGLASLSSSGNFCRVVDFCASGQGRTTGGHTRRGAVRVFLGQAEAKRGLAQRCKVRAWKAGLIEGMLCVTFRGQWRGFFSALRVHPAK
jgi:hypothetical protein